MNKHLYQITLALVALALPFRLVSQPELWFGGYTDENGHFRQGRFIVEEREGKIEKVQLAPYGIAPLDLKVVQHDTAQGLLQLEWPGDPLKTCTLIGYHPFFYSGNWVKGTWVEPMIIKKFDRQDAERQGNWFQPSATEVEIIEVAASLLSTDARWNRNDNRVCDDPTAFSLFCALFEASVAVDGEYRHLRPALKVVRDVIEQRHPGKYDHVLLDFNNAQGNDMGGGTRGFENIQGQAFRSNTAMNWVGHRLLSVARWRPPAYVHGQHRIIQSLSRITTISLIVV